MVKALITAFQSLTDAMLLQTSTAFVLIQLIISSHALICYKTCTIRRVSPTPLDVPPGECELTIADACEILILFNYGTREYSVSLGTLRLASYIAIIEARPSNYLSSVVSYSCTDSDSCALDFAKKKLVELAARKYNLAGISAEITAIVQASPKPTTALICADNDACPSGVCKIEFDTVSNTQMQKECGVSSDDIGVSAGGGARTGSFDVKCNQPKCNTPETLNKAKAIFVKYNLTDADGRVTDVGRRDESNQGGKGHGHSIVASVIVVVGLALFSSIVV